MLFLVGIEIPAQACEAYGIIVPVFEQVAGYGWVSAADHESDILHQARDAILTMAEQLADDGQDLTQLDQGFKDYSALADYADYQQWLALEVDVSGVSKQQRVNISLSGGLLARIDTFVQRHPSYKDRSHFLSQAANHEMALAEAH